MKVHIVPLVVASALFMENLDSSVLSTALPVIARDLGTDPVHLKLALTSYMLSIAVFVPASGWIADRFGARRVFVLAMLVFMLGSILCGFSWSLPALVGARIVQGLGGALMLPVGRLVVLRSVPREELVGSLAWLTVPALMGPLLGPAVGGLVVTVTDWRWIFWINIPIGLIGVTAALRLLPDHRAEVLRRFDGAGFMLSGLGLALVVAAAALAGVGAVSIARIAGLAVVGMLVLALYAVHAVRTPHPILDPRLLKLATFRASLMGGTLFRIGVGASPFLLPLLLQLGLGFDPLTAGLLTASAGLGAVLMKFAAQPILDRFGFRRTLVVNGAASAILLPMPLLFTAHTPYLLIGAGLLFAAFLRSLQFTAVNAIAYADIDDDNISQASSFAAVAQQIGWSFGVSFAAIILDVSRSMRGETALALVDFRWSFAIMAAISALSVLHFLRLSAEAGGRLRSRRGR